MIDEKVRKKQKLNNTVGQHECHFTFMNRDQLLLILLWYNHSIIESKAMENSYSLSKLRLIVALLSPSSFLAVTLYFPASSTVTLLISSDAKYDIPSSFPTDCYIRI